MYNVHCVGWKTQKKLLTVCHPTKSRVCSWWLRSYKYILRNPDEDYHPEPSLPGLLDNHQQPVAARWSRTSLSPTLVAAQVASYLAPQVSWLVEAFEGEGAPFQEKVLECHVRLQHRLSYTITTCLERAWQVCTGRKFSLLICKTLWTARSNR